MVCFDARKHAFRRDRHHNGSDGQLTIINRCINSLWLWSTKTDNALAREIAFLFSSLEVVICKIRDGVDELE